jgi:solute carrier family 38 (sodium-coupled neutral amino acid transporter), member 7/8
MDIFTVLPVICFGYQCHVNSVPIYACLKKKSMREFTKAIVVSIVIIFTIYCVSASYGYLTFGDKVDDDLLKSYNAKDVTVVIAVVMFLFKNFTAYPLNLFCARTAIEGLWIEVFRLDAHNVERNEPKRRIIIVSVWFILSILLALFIPNISIVIHYLGTLAGAFMFIFPGI